MSGFCCVCHVFPPHVSRFGLFPVLVKCHYELILVQPCLSNYLWFTCVFIVLSVQFDLVWSTRYFPLYLVCKPCLVLPWCLIKYYYLSLYPRLRVPAPPCCVHRNNESLSCPQCEKMDLKIIQSLLERVQIHKMLDIQRICGTWRMFVKNSRQFNCSGQTRDLWITITIFFLKIKKHSCGSSR